MKYLSLKFFIVVAFISCTKEESTEHEAYISNPNDFKVSIYFYSSSMIFDSIIFNGRGSVKIGKGFDRGIANHAGFGSQILMNSDSIVVRFDDQYQISHYLHEPVNSASHYYKYSSIRNLFNYLSYRYDFKDISRSKRLATYEYQFSLQDYADAL